METALHMAGGLILLVIGGEVVVRGAVGVARRFGVSDLIIGLTLVAMGTSAPELLTSVEAAWLGSPGISVGNVFGSNISNILLIFAIVAIIKPVAIEQNAIRRDGSVMIAATLLIIAIGLGVGRLDRWVGVLLVVALAGYIVMAWRMERQNKGVLPTAHAAEAPSHHAKPAPIAVSIMLALAGFGLLVLGADLLVTGAIALAQLAGMSETVIGLTIVAIGTSLPEFVAALVAALRGSGGIAFGNIVGSNIYNILGILGVTAIVAPIPFPPDIEARDWIALLGSSLLLIVHAWTGARVSRWEGTLLLSLYGVYAATLLAST